MNRRLLLQALGGLVLVAGLAWSFMIYRAAEAEEARLLAAQAAGGAFHQVDPRMSKRFLHDMEVYGGKANVMMFRFQTWLGELFLGKSLAAMVGVFSLITAAGCIYAARCPEHPAEDPAHPVPR